MSEHADQAAIAAALPLLLAPGVRWTSIDHAAAITPRQGAERKRRGVARGLPDLLFWWAPKMAAAVELKTAKGRLSPEQIAFRDHWTAAGHLHAVCRGLDEVRATLAVWGIGREASQRAA